jgi:phosphatidylglycerol---prolipoprotein diacylglyceryl transferase
MRPQPLPIFGIELEIWNVVFLLSVFAGYGMLRGAFAIGRRAARPRWLLLRWVVTVYLSAIGAQLFAYAFDLNTTLLPPPSISWARYYFEPLAGPKMLYGAVLTLPLGILLIGGRLADGSFHELLDRWTPAMMATLATTRVGCFLQGCCYGRRHDTLGTAFPPGSPVYFRQLHDRLINEGSHALPVIATQLLEALVLFALSAWCLWALRAGRAKIFFHGVALYSIARLALEFLRDDPERNALGPLSSSQWIAIAVLAVYGYWRQRHASRRPPLPAPDAIRG